MKILFIKSYLIMQNKEETEEKELEIIEKLPSELLSEHLGKYAKSANLEGYAKIGLIIFPVLVLIHNIFIAGRSYDYQTYESIKNTEITIVGILVAILIILAIIAMVINSNLNESLAESAKRYGIKKELMEEEFSLLAIHLYGGRGVKLK